MTVARKTNVDSGKISAVSFLYLEPESKSPFLVPEAEKDRFGKTGDVDVLQGKFCIACGKATIFDRRYYVTDIMLGRPRKKGPTFADGVWKTQSREIQMNLLEQRSYHCLDICPAEE